MTILLFIMAINFIFILLAFYNYQKVYVPLIITLMILIMAACYDVVDYGMYKSMYESSGYMGYTIESILSDSNNLYSPDKGYALLNELFLDAGLSYVEFRFIISVVCLFILWRIASKITHSIVLVFSLYMIVPFFFDAMQVRNFYAAVFLFVAIYVYSKYVRVDQDDLNYHLYSADFRGALYFITIMLIGTSIHKVLFFYLPFFLYDYLQSKRISKYICISLSAIGMMLPIYSGILQGNVALTNFLFENATSEGMERLAIYSSLEINPLRMWFDWSYLLLMLIILGYVLKCLKYNSAPILTVRYVYTVRQLFFYLTLTLPLLAMAPNMGRIYRNIMLMGYIAIATYFDYCKVRYKSLKLIILFVLVAIIGYGELYYTYGNAALDVLNNNYIMDYLGISK